MAQIVQWIKREFFHVLPAFLFFLVAFSFIDVTEDLLLRRGGIHFSFWTIFIASLLVAKIVLVVDHLAFMRMFEKKPLIWSVLWKTVVYAVAIFSIRFLIRWSPFLFRSEPFDLFLSTVDWAIFWAVQMWYYMLFFVFNFSRGLIQFIGAEKARRIFFG